MNEVFQVTRWRGDNQLPLENARLVRNQVPSDTNIWGIWFGLFGLRANELLVVTHAATPNSEVLATVPGNVEDTISMVPTVRPTSTTPPQKEGLYVFRFFDTHPQHIDEIASLSNTAWTTFESTTEYHAEPLALFASHNNTDDAATMLLITWYDTFDSWQISRQPHPDAKQNFLRRRALTTSTLPIATRLIVPGQ